MNNTEIDELYRDQAVRSTKFYDRIMTSAYTPWGIRKLDTLFCNRIRAFKRGESYIEYSYNYSDCHKGLPPKKEIENVWKDNAKILTHDIKTNPHLHPKIKENLLFNLNQK